MIGGVVRTIAAVTLLTAGNASAGGYVAPVAIPESFVFPTPSAPQVAFDAQGVLWIGGAAVVLCMLFCGGKGGHAAPPAPAPEIAPVPLPASGPMLGALISLVFFAARRRRGGSK